MPDVWLQCTRCQSREQFAAHNRGCPRCSKSGHREPLTVAYGSFPTALLPDDTRPGLWRWHRWLPPCAGEVSLHEGRSTLHQLPDGTLLFNETRNPTWSWKDRPNAVTASLARHWGFRRLVVISTGNHGVAAAAYSAVAELECLIFCHPQAPELCTRLMERFGAHVVRTEDAERLVLAELDRGDTYPGTTLDASHGYSNPLGIEGFKTIAFEIVFQLRGMIPDRVYIPVGSGDGIAGIAKGFRELNAAGVIGRVPQLVACQPAGASSLAVAAARGIKKVAPLETIKTRALSLAERRTSDHALAAVDDSLGAVQTATDEEAAFAALELAKHGIAVELSSAVAYAVARRRVFDDKLCVVIGSGAVTKWPDDLLPRSAEWLRSDCRK